MKEEREELDKTWGIVNQQMKEIREGMSQIRREREEMKQQIQEIKAQQGEMMSEYVKKHIETVVTECVKKNEMQTQIDEITDKMREQ